VALKISLVEKRLRNVEKELQKLKGGSVSLSLDPNALKELGGKLAEEEKQDTEQKEKEEAEKESPSPQKTEEK